VPQFYLARHGETDDDVPGREKVTGWLDVPLNKRGRQNASKAGRFLQRKGITHIVSSDATRAEQTADIVADVTGLKVVVSDKLCSWNMGAMAGMDVEAAKPFLTFFQKKPDCKPPEGEPFQQFYNRFKGAFYGMVSYVKRFPDSKPLMVTHSQAMDIIPWFLKDIEPGQALEFGEGIPPGGVMEVRIAEDGKITFRELRVN
jgi:broad specificity phosphatase PhoE